MPKWACLDVLRIVLCECLRACLDVSWLVAKLPPAVTIYSVPTSIGPVFSTLSRTTYRKDEERQNTAL